MNEAKPIKVRIEVATTWIRLKTDRVGDIGGISIAKYIYNNLMEHEYLPRFDRWEIKSRYALLDEKSSYAYMPRYALDDLIGAIQREASSKHVIVDIETVNVDPVTPHKIKMSMVDNFALRGHQPEMIEFFHLV